MKSYNSLPEELAFVSKLAYISPSYNKENTYINSSELENIDWNRFLQFCTFHQLSPLIYYNITHILNFRLPDKIMSTLKHKYIANLFYMDKLCNELARVMQGFQDNNVFTVTYKGPVLAQVLFGDPSLRISGDLDLLVNPNDLPIVHSLMLSWGYSPLTLFGDKEIQSLIESDRKHHIHYTHTVKSIHVEIHWKLFDSYISPYQFDNFKNYIDEYETVQLNGVSYPVCASNLVFITLCLHGSKHIWGRLRWLIDIMKLLEQSDTLNWSQIYQIAKDNKFLPVIGQTLSLLKIIFHYSPPLHSDFLYDSPKNTQLVQMVLKGYNVFRKQDNQHVFSFHTRLNRKYLYLLFSSRKTKMKQILWFVIPLIRPSQNDFDMLTLPRLLYPLYYLLRPLLGVIRIIKKFYKNNKNSG